MKTYLVTFYKRTTFWQEIITVTDVATDIWLNDSLPGIPYEIKEVINGN